MTANNLIYGCLLLLCTACSTVGPEYYRLPDSIYRTSAVTQAPIVVSVRLADSLDQGSMAYQTSSAEIRFAQNHLWTDGLDKDIAAVLANRLNEISSFRRYTVDEPANGTAPVLAVRIEAFQGRHDGTTRIAGYTACSGFGTAQYCRPANFDVVTPQNGDGYAAMVHSLAEGLKTVADRIRP